MKKIICYGDSNTFGFNPKDGTRFDENTRWTAILQKKLGTEYEVVNEGACDRTGFVNNPKGFEFSAQRHFPKMISKIDNIDILIIALGTNDLQFQYSISVGAIEKGLENLIKLAQTKAEDIIIIPPLILSEKILEGSFNFQFDQTSIVKSRKIGRIYRQISNAYHCNYFDINKFTKPSDVDGLHYNEESHKIIGDNLSNLINKLSGQDNI